MSKKIGTISGLEWALEQLTEKPIQPDEFTAKMLFEGQTNRTIAGCRSLLQRQSESGLLTSRKILINGAYERVYKKA
jgi:hypothetical protein